MATDTKLADQVKYIIRQWLPAIVLIALLIGLAIWATQCHYSLPQPVPPSTQTAVACSSNGYTAVYYPFKGSPYQTIILENASGEGSSLDKFLHTQIQYGGNRALQDIQNLTCLEELDIMHVETRGKTLTDLSPLSKLTHLKELFIDWTNASDLTPLAHLTSLTMLRIFDSPVENLPDLSALQKLTTLYICNNGNYPEVASPTNFEDIKPIGKLVNLENLLLCLDKPTDLTPLYGLKKLKQINIYGAWSGLSPNSIAVNPLPKNYPEEITELKKALPRAKVLFGESESPLIIK